MERERDRESKLSLFGREKETVVLHKIANSCKIHKIIKQQSITRVFGHEKRPKEEERRPAGWG